ncbi:fatty acyl-CoA reductase wat [Helicoverpa armigera]|uniref:fatty acyl-CoA reductase wat n=1 Tax=Helicoverpa armigera TaxID=29058 RepID=UPI00308320B8
MTLNAAEIVEQAALALQKPMNDVIDRGDSAVQQFYCGATVFVTGGSGFLGKQLVEKLFRACKINKIYMLLRQKKGKNIKDRLEEILKDPVYDMLKEKQPKFAERIIPVEGEVADLRLGISDADWSTLTSEVDTIFHVAATVRFDEALAKATFINIRGTREALALGRACPKLKCFVHVSTAFSHATFERIGKEIREEFYKTPVSPHILIKMAQEMDSERLDGITPALTKGWPNTYTFTKAVAEEMVRTDAGDLPVTIVRPPAVIGSYYEPSPGWMDMSCVYSTSGIILGVGMGLIHVANVDKHVALNVAPVDMVNNTILAAGWQAKERDDKNEVKIYALATGEQTVTFDYTANIMRKECVKFSANKAIWYCSLIEVKNRFLYNIVALLLHYIPAFFIDIIAGLAGLKLQGKPVSFTKIYEKYDKLLKTHGYFLAYEFDFKDDNLKGLRSKMSDADKAIFNCDLRSYEKNLFVKVWCLGVRKYIIQDGLRNVRKAYRKQIYFGIANYVFLALYFYTLYCLFCYSWFILKYVFANL